MDGSVGGAGAGAEGAGAPGAAGTPPGTRWLAFDHPGSPEPVGLLRLTPDGRVHYLDRDGSWQADDALTPALLAGRTREVGAAEAAAVAARLRAARP